MWYDLTTTKISHKPHSGKANRGYSTLVNNHSRDLPNSRLITSRTSAPNSMSFVPQGDVGKTVCQRNINKRVLPRVFPGAGWCPFGNPNHVETFTSGVRVVPRESPSSHRSQLPSRSSVECLREIAATFTTFTTVTVVPGLALPCPALSLRCRCQAELLLARE